MILNLKLYSQTKSVNHGCTIKRFSELSDIKELKVYWYQKYLYTNIINIIDNAWFHYKCGKECKIYKLWQTKSNDIEVERSKEKRGDCWFLGDR